MSSFSTLRSFARPEPLHAIAYRRSSPTLAEEQSPFPAPAAAFPQVDADELDLRVDRPRGRSTSHTLAASSG